MGNDHAAELLRNVQYAPHLNSYQSDSKDRPFNSSAVDRQPFHDEVVCHGDMRQQGRHQCATPIQSGSGDGIVALGRVAEKGSSLDDPNAFSALKCCSMSATSR